MKIYVAEREVVQGLDASLGCGCEAVYLLLCEREPIKSRRSISTCEGRIHAEILEDEFNIVVLNIQF